MSLNLLDPAGPPIKRIPGSYQRFTIRIRLCDDFAVVIPDNAPSGDFVSTSK